MISYIQSHTYLCYINIPSSTLIAFFGLKTRTGGVRVDRKGGIKSTRNKHMDMYIYIYTCASIYINIYVYIRIYMYLHI
jgi:hypothetical protein